MIFYFSGTGNSKHVAIKVAEALKDSVVYMTENELHRRNTYMLQTEEKIGFVFPVYWYGIPSMVVRFIKQLQLGNYEKQYVFSIFTYGASCGNTYGQLKKLLSEKQWKLQAGFGIKMVDNYILAYDIMKEDERTEVLCKAEQEIEFIIEKIQKNSIETYYKAGWQKPLSPLLQLIYQKSNHSKHFHVTDACIHCNRCVKECPTNSICIKENQLVWNNKCCGCLKCIHGCPTQAIQYGKRTIKRGRYQFQEK